MNLMEALGGGVFVYSHRSNFLAIWWLSSLPVTSLQMYAYHSWLLAVMVLLRATPAATQDSVFKVISERSIQDYQSKCRALGEGAFFCLFVCFICSRLSNFSAIRRLAKEHSLPILTS
jgi:hypothetical protein